MCVCNHAPNAERVTIIMLYVLHAGCVYECGSVPDGSYNLCGNSCNTYVICSGGIESFMTCPPFLSFDEFFKTCTMTSSTCPGTTRHEFGPSFSSSSFFSSPTQGMSSEDASSPTSIHSTDISTSPRELNPAAASSTSKSPATTSATTWASSSTTTTTTTTTGGVAATTTTTQYPDVSNVSTAAASQLVSYPNFNTIHLNNQ